VFPDEGGRLALSPIDPDAADSKLGKVVNKRQVAGGDFQLTLHDGQTLLVETGEYAPKDSVVVDNETGEVVAHFPYEEGALVTAVAGEHAGDIGTVEEITVTPSSSPNNVRVETDDGWFETVEGYVVVIDENFTGEASETPREDGEAVDADDADEDVTEDETGNGEPADVESETDVDAETETEDDETDDEEVTEE
jgi:small subunit ribosomal protein S4e